MTLKKKGVLITILSILMVLFSAVGFNALSVLADAEKNDKIIISSDTNGYLVSEEVYELQNNDISVCFEVSDILNSGNDYFGFGVVKSGEESDFFVDENNAQNGLAILFDEQKTYVLGDDECNIFNSAFSKSNLLKSGYKIKATFSYSEIIIETSLVGSNSYSTVQKISNIKEWDNGNYSFAILYSTDVNIILNDLTFSTEEKIIDSYNYTIDNSIIKTDGDAFIEIEANGVSAYGNTTAISSLEDNLVTVSLTTSSFEIDESSKIGFAIGDNATSGNIFGNLGVFVAFSKTSGIEIYKNGNLTDAISIDDYVNAESIFASGREIKGIFDVSAGSFSLLVKYYQGAKFTKVLGVDELDLPKTNIYAGLQFNGNVSLKASSFLVFGAVAVSGYAQFETYLHTPENVINSTAINDGNGRVEINMIETSDYVPNYSIYSKNPINVSNGKSAVLLLENITEYQMQSLKYAQSIMFVFANNINSQSTDYYMYSNEGFTMAYETSRSTWFITRANGGYENQVMDYSVTFNELVAVGNSIMAVFDVENQSYSLYVKSAGESNYVLMQSFTLPKSYAGLELKSVNSSLYAGITLSYGMDLTIDNLAVYTANTVDIAKSNVATCEYSGDGIGQNGGFTFSADENGYISYKNIDISNVETVVLEYSLEKLTYAGGSHLLGFFITNGVELPSNPVVKNRIDDTIIEPGEMISGDKCEYYAYNSSNSLTPDANDNMRDYIFHTGYSIRVLFNLIERTTTIQFKGQGEFSWNNIATYDDLPSFDLDNDKLTVALRLQKNVNLSLSNVTAYTISNKTNSFGYDSVGGMVEDLGTATMCSANVKSQNNEQGVCYIDEQDVLEKYVVQGTEIIFTAIPNDEYIFKGWYADGKLVSTDIEYAVEITSDINLVGEFASASKITILNGIDKTQTEVSSFYQDDSFIGINPQNMAGYNFVGWEISYISSGINGDTVISNYYLSLTAETNNVLSEENLFVWKSLKNGISADTNFLITKNDTGSNTLSFGVFNVIDRKGYEKGTLILQIPNVKSSYEDGEIVTERYIKVQAKYQLSGNGNSFSTDKEYSDEYMGNLSTSIRNFIIVAVSTVVIVAGLCVLKFVVLKKKRK